MKSILAVIGAIFVVGLAPYAQAGTVFYIYGLDSDNPATTITGGQTGGTSIVQAEGGAQYTISFAGSPSPTITLSGVTGSGQTSFDAIWDYNANISFPTLYPPSSQTCLKGSACLPPPLRPIGFGQGVSTFYGTGFSAGTGIRTAYDTGVVYGDSCDTQSTACNFSASYVATLGERGGVLCVSVGGCLPGQEALFSTTVPIQIEIQGHMYGGDGGAMTITVDPYITLNNAWFQALGADPANAVITFDDPTITNSQGSVSAAPEPVVWMMMVFGIGAVGLALRRRRPAELLAM